MLDILFHRGKVTEIGMVENPAHGTESWHNARPSSKVLHNWMDAEPLDQQRLITAPSLRIAGGQGQRMAYLACLQPLAEYLKEDASLFTIYHHAKIIEHHQGPGAPESSLAHHHPGRELGRHLM